jgi:hypothetical protein
MRDELHKQISEKKEKDHIEKKMANEQAHMWAKDKVNYETEEEKLARKIKQIN